MPLLCPLRAQVETQLRQVNAQFARLNGMSGAHMLDLYGRTAVVAPPPAAPAAALQRKASKRLPLSEATRALIRQAHSKLPRDVLGGSLPGSQAASQPGSPPVGGAAAGALLASQPASRTPSASFGAGGVLHLGGALSRQATVRFDMPQQAGQAAAGGAGQAGGSRPPAAAGPGGVLHIPDEREDRLLPYRSGLRGPLGQHGGGGGVCAVWRCRPALSSAHSTAPPPLSLHSRAA